jgi:microcystin-dependent protein
VVVLGLGASAVSAKGIGSGGMGADPMIGEIALVALDFAPRGYMEANGQMLLVSQNQALFSLYGTVYGGDGTRTFALPKMDPPLAGLKYIVAVQGVYPQRP